MLARGYGGGCADPVHRDLLLFGLYTGMRRGEIMPLQWERVDLGAGLFRVEETKTGVPLELPVTRQLGAIPARRRAESDAVPASETDSASSSCPFRSIPARPPHGPSTKESS